MKEGYNISAKYKKQANQVAALGTCEERIRRSCTWTLNGGTYQEFRNEPPKAPWDTAGNLDAIHKVAMAKGIEVKFSHIQGTQATINQGGQ